MSKDAPSENLRVYRWKDSKSLEAAIQQEVGIWRKGNAQNEKLDAIQLITPYRIRYFGSARLNQRWQELFPSSKESVEFYDKAFNIGDKVLCVKNVYRYEKRRRRLIVSNGSIGRLIRQGKDYLINFPEVNEPIPLFDFREDEIELGHALSVHKAQGSGFDHVLLVLPRQKALLTRELVYTALSRAKESMALFIQDGEESAQDWLSDLRLVSSTDSRRTSLFNEQIVQHVLSPAPGVRVRSRAEYIIYQKLDLTQRKTNDFEFYYEQPLELNGVTIRPDFTIVLRDGSVRYLEHLGMLSDRGYARSWNRKRKLYEHAGLGDSLVTTDELRGIDDSIVQVAVDQCVSTNTPTGMQTFSRHHISL